MTPQLQKKQPNFTPIFASYSIYMAFTIVKKFIQKNWNKIKRIMLKMKNRTLSK